MIEPRHDRFAPAGRDRIGDARIIGRDPNGPDIGLHRAPPDVDDHRLAMDVGERFARQARGGHAGGNNDRSD